AVRRQWSREARLRRVRLWLVFFMVALVLSGLTAFPLESELRVLAGYWPGSVWINRVYGALRDVNARYPFLAYGYDWLAFAHLVIAVAFIGPLRDPVRNIWVIGFGMIACVMIFPLAFIAGAVRGIPVWWRAIDCAFGVAGVVPLAICYREVRTL
ncbi:MAG TPA: hypothetical protein VL547_09815, partial [Dinghuibacter sp.]|uniref:hypothetical protein n=1 Tax=Dinghuibacter sp. TaxID=2024697 RepID=UPI002C3F6FE3